MHCLGMDQAASPAAQGEFTRLGRGESLRLLAGVPVGRLIFTINALPAVRPMNFALVDGPIMLRSGTLALLAGPFDPWRSGGWAQSRSNAERRWFIPWRREGSMRTPPAEKRRPRWQRRDAM